jgi:small subunit ribosomal protein S21|tara:strand:- start:595 stop:792 length:198 start_codon:yes stop_codon:yes gene_type:complete
MLIIKLKKGENINRALKRLKVKFKNTQVIRQIRDKQYFKKPSLKRREEIQNAIYKQKVRDNEEQN